MTKKIKALIAVGGTGGHVFPGCHLAKNLLERNYEIQLVTDKRGYKYLKNFKDLNITKIPSSPFLKKNLFSFFFSTMIIIYSILRSLIFLSINRPSIIFGMGGYASFPICVAAYILRIRFIIYENNLILGKANKYLLSLSEKILVSYRELEGIPFKFKNKIVVSGNIINKEIINIPKEFKTEKINQKLNILVLGGSQAAKIFAEVLPGIFQNCQNAGIPIKVYQHCLPEQNNELISFYKNAKVEFKAFNFSHNLKEYFVETNLAITRAGSSMLAELTNANIPFISVPLPSSTDNHQLKNAIFYEKKKFGFLIEEKDLKTSLFNLISKIYNRNLIASIKSNQRQYSDKNVYDNINKVLKEIFYEKN